MTNAEYLHKEGKLNSFLYRFAEINTSEELGDFCRYYGIGEEKIDIANWLMAEHKEVTMAGVGTRVKGELDGHTIYGTVKISVMKNGANEVWVDWDEIEPFKMVHTMNVNVFEVR
jgi:hypothetical protein